jgi:spermidine synthase
MVRAGLLFGMVNAAAALFATWVLGPAVGPPRGLRYKGALVLLALGALLAFSGRLAGVAEDGAYPDPVVYTRQTPYQRIVMTAGRGSFQLFLDGNLQFASADEHRYHEALVHPAFAAASAHRNVLVLGGGDGLATREILRYPDVERVTLVDLDDAMTTLARTHPRLLALNQGALRAPRVRVVNDDAMVWLDQGREVYDVVIVDFPDPNNFSLGKLYTTRFYALLARHLAPASVVVVQSTSPLVARRSFWCVARTMEAAGLHVLPYHTAVPSFGEWGYVLASLGPLAVPRHTRADLRYLDDAVLPTLFVFGRDMQPVPVEVNRLNNQVLVQYYDQEWRR